MSLIPLDIEAVLRPPGQDEDARVTVRGQSRVAKHPGKVEAIRLLPEAPPATPEALESIKLADVVVLGPGSWFTSVMPHLLVPDLLQALHDTPATRVLTLNVSLTDDEASGYTVAGHVETILQHAPRPDLRPRDRRPPRSCPRRRSGRRWRRRWPSWAPTSW